MKCKHNSFSTEAMINRLDENAEGYANSYMLDLKVTCEECNTPFRFIGLPIGLDLNGAAVSVDGVEGHFAIASKGDVLPQIDGVTGYTVRKKSN